MFRLIPAVFLACLIVAAEAGAIELAPHRAIYSMELLRVRSGGEIADVDGRMYLEWSDVCDGWTLSQQVRMTFVPRDGEARENDFSFSSWESRDGNKFRYTMRTLSNGVLVEQVLGRAMLEGEGEAGVAGFKAPEQTDLDLPAGTIFPTRHLYQVIEHAMGGGRSLSKAVFSGTGLDSLNDTTAFIGPEIPPGGESVDSGDDNVSALGDRASWPIAMAYYPFGEDNSAPEFEVQYRIMDNGVASNMDLDYGDFALRAVLDHLEYLPAPDC